MRFILSLLVLCILALPVQARTAAEERREISTKFVELFRKQQFVELNELAAKYRSGREKTSSGDWKLASFYAGVDSIATKNDDDYRWWSVESSMHKWLREHPSPAAHIAYAKLLLNHAQKIHGDVPDDMVDPNKAWPIYSRVGKAHDDLLNCISECSADPEFFVTLIALADMEHWDRQSRSELFTVAVKTHTYYDPIYYGIAHYYKPAREDGSYADFENFANEAVSYTGEKYGYGIYPRIYMYAFDTDSLPKTDIFKTTLVDWRTMRTGIDDTLKNYPDDWNLNRFAYLSCRAGDMDETRKLMDRIKTRMNEAWGNDDNKFDLCQEMSH